MLGNAHFYNRTIRKVVVAFGTIFNDIYVTRYNKAGTVAYEQFKVPLSYGSKEKYITRLSSDSNLDKSVAVVVPRISFEMTSLTYDSSRKQLTTLRNFSANSSTTSIQTQYLPIPYDFEFSMSIYVRNTEDGTQIIEQILPFFTPDFTVTVNFIPEMDQKYDLPIVLNSVTTSTDYEGDMTTTRLITWDLTFTAKGYIWPAVKNGSLIRQANTTINIENQNKDSQNVTVDYANGTGYFSVGEVARVVNKDITGTVSYFSNNSNGILILDNLNKLLEAGDKVTGDKTNASFTVSTTSSSPQQSVTIRTVPVPSNAEIDDEFGFAETITEWPDT